MLCVRVSVQRSSRRSNTLFVCYVSRCRWSCLSIAYWIMHNSIGCHSTRCFCFASVTLNQIGIVRRCNDGKSPTDSSRCRLYFLVGHTDKQDNESRCIFGISTTNRYVCDHRSGQIPEWIRTNSKQLFNTDSIYHPNETICPLSKNKNSVIFFGCCLLVVFGWLDRLVSQTYFLLYFPNAHLCE